MINLNKLAKAVAMKEGLKEEVNIAQIKEIIRITIEEMAGYRNSEVLQLMERHQILE